MMNTLTNEERWNNAIDELRENGVLVAENVMECCRGCVDFHETFGTDSDESEPNAWTYGGQSNGYTWNSSGDTMLTVNETAYEYYEDDEDDEGEEVIEYEVGGRAGAIQFNHDNDAGQLIVNAFATKGFKVEWDHTEADCVTVYPNNF